MPNYQTLGLSAMIGGGPDDDERRLQMLRGLPGVAGPSSPQQRGPQPLNPILQRMGPPAPAPARIRASYQGTPNVAATPPDVSPFLGGGRMGTASLPPPPAPPPPMASGPPPHRMDIQNGSLLEAYLVPQDGPVRALHDMPPSPQPTNPTGLSDLIGGVRDFREAGGRNPYTGTYNLNQPQALAMYMQGAPQRQNADLAAGQLALEREKFQADQERDAFAREPAGMEMYLISRGASPEVARAFAQRMAQKAPGGGGPFAGPAPLPDWNLPPGLLSKEDVRGRILGAPGGTPPHWRQVMTNLRNLEEGHGVVSQNPELVLATLLENPSLGGIEGMNDIVLEEGVVRLSNLFRPQFTQSARQQHIAERDLLGDLLVHQDKYRSKLPSGNRPFIRNEALRKSAPQR